MVTGCGLSGKTNKRKGARFLYFWWYENGRKNEKYLGRFDDNNAKIKGLNMMLRFYRKQDAELHIKIGELSEKLVAIKINEYSLPLSNSSVISNSPDYMPELED